jgi:hypothetical protein
MTHPYKKPVAKPLPLSRVALITGLLMCGSQVTVTRAQLGPCTPLQEEHGDTSCESPRENSKSLFETMKGWFGFSSEQPRGETLRGLEPLPKSGITNDPYERDPIVKPSQPPINGVRDYLNRQDPGHAIYPVDPGASALGKP